MPEQSLKDDDSPASGKDEAKEGRRPLLRKLGRFAAITPPAIALLLAAATKPARAISSPIL